MIKCSHRLWLWKNSAQQKKSALVPAHVNHSKNHCHCKFAVLHYTASVRNHVCEFEIDSSGGTGGLSSNWDLIGEDSSPDNTLYYYFLFFFNFKFNLNYVFYSSCFSSVGLPKRIYVRIRETAIPYEIRYKNR